MNVKMICMIALLLCVTTVFTACHRQSGDAVKTTTANAPAQSEDRQLCFYDYAAYKTHIDSHILALPDHFVPYSSLAPLGEFSGCVFLNTAYAGQDYSPDLYSWYMYSLVAENGSEFALYVDHNDRDSVLLDAETLHSSSINPSDMRKLRTEKQANYWYNEICYRYIAGELVGILWKENDAMLSISIDPSTDYSGTTIEKIMNLQEVDSIIHSIEIP